jgi:hypothetical protein
MTPFPLTKGGTYWLTNPRLGTHEAVLVLVSPNHKSLGFELRSAMLSRVGNGILYHPTLPLLHDPQRGYIDFFTGEGWEILERAPVRPPPA